jgi:hypothetical protein
MPRRIIMKLFKSLLLILSILVVTSGFVFSEPKEPVNESLNTILNYWDTILGRVVRKGTVQGIDTTLVNYTRLKKDKRFQVLLDEISVFDIKSLKTNEEKVAFWINVYNISAVKVILENYPVQGIKKIGTVFNTVWSSSTINVDGRDISLSDIEHHILRKLNEPRIHAAIVCASLSCPDLKPYSYRPIILSRQLDRSMTDFLKNSTKGMRNKEGTNVVKISKVFKWFKADFNDLGGVSELVNGSLKTNYKKFRISYFDYNWDLNDYKK